MPSLTRRAAVAVIAAPLFALAAGAGPQTGSQSWPPRRVTGTAPEVLNLNPTLSGDGSRVAFESGADLAAGGAGGGFRLVAAATSTRDSFKELALARAPAPALSQDGTRVAFPSRDHPAGENADGNSEIFFHDGGRLRQLTHTLPDDPARRISQGCFRPSISDDGRLVAFASDRDLAGDNPDRNPEIFLLDALTHELRQLTNLDGGPGSRDAKVSGDGSRVVFVRDRLADGGAALSDLLIYATSSGETLTAAAGLQALTMTYGRAVSDDGLRAVFSARGPDGAAQVFMLDGRNHFAVRQLTQLGTRPADVPLHPTVSGDGNRVAFATRRSATGGGDTGVELYLHDIPTKTTTRLTDAPAGATGEVVSSLDDEGTLVAFSFPRVLADRDVDETFANNPEIFLAELPRRAPSGGGLQIFSAAVPGKAPPAGALAGGSMAILTGRNLSLSSEAAVRRADNSFPTALRNVSVSVGGRAAQIFFVSPSQINFVVPDGLEDGPAAVSVRNHDGYELRGAVNVARAAPGLFTAAGTGSGEVLALDNSTLGQGPFDVTDAAGGPRRLIIFCTGLREATKIEALVGGRGVRVEAVVPSPELPGLDQLHVALPASLRGAGTVPLVVRADGAEGNRASLALTAGGPPPRAARVELSPASATIPVGGEMRFRVRAYDSLGEEIDKPSASFSVGDGAVAAVNSSGLATGLAPGDSKVRAAIGEAAAEASLRVVTRTLVVNEVLADPPDGPAGDANHDGTRDGAEDEFVELVNGSDHALDLTGWTLRTRALNGSAESVRHNFPHGSVLPAGEALALFGGGTPAADDPFFGGALVARASSGSLSLTNAGLTILVRDGAGNLVTQFSYGASGDGLGGDPDQSVTRSPDITGAFAPHTAADAARKFSPGVKLDGTFFLERAGRLTRVVLSGTPQAVFVGDNAQFTAQAFDQYGRPFKRASLSFESSEPSVAAVEGTGADPNTGASNATLRGLSPGLTQVRATATDGPFNATSAAVGLLVRERPPRVARVEVSPAAVELNRGGSARLTATAFGEDGRPVPSASFSWSTGDASVAAVDAAGVLTAAGIGPVRVTAVTPDNRGSDVSGHAEVSVRLPLVINELLADVPPDDADTAEVEGDANSDGVRSPDDDEFVELLNTSGEPLELSGLQISDASGVRFTFPSHTTLEAGRAVVVFGGGSPPPGPDAFAGALVLKSNSLSLNDTGDTLTVRLPLAGRTLLVAALVYGAGGAVAAAKDQSLTRSPDAGADAGFTAHEIAAGSAGRPYSPGRRADGTPFGSPPLTRVEVAPASVTLDIGARQEFVARAFARAGGVEVEVPLVRFIWSPGDAKKASVSPSEGLTTVAAARASGMTNLFARAGGVEGTATLHVNPTPTPTPSPTPSPRPSPTPTPTPTPTATPSPTPAPGPTPRALVVVSQVYGGAGCTTQGCSTYKNDFVELYNRGTGAVALGGWSVQYAPATGTGAWQVTALPDFTLAPGQRFLVQEAGNANGVSALPAPDAAGSLALGATAGKVALVGNTTPLGRACPSASAVLDLVGYGSTANCFETARAPAPGTTTAVIRNTDGCADTNDNSRDFSAGRPNPRNSAAAPRPCAAAQAKTGEPYRVAEGVPPSFNFPALPEAPGALYDELFSGRPPRAGSTRWRRAAWAYAPRGRRGDPPRPPGAWP